MKFHLALIAAAACVGAVMDVWDVSAAVISNVDAEFYQSSSTSSSIELSKRDLNGGEVAVGGNTLANIASDVSLLEQLEEENNSRLEKRSPDPKGKKKKKKKKVTRLFVVIIWDLVFKSQSPLPLSLEEEEEEEVQD